MSAVTKNIPSEKKEEILLNMSEIKRKVSEIELFMMSPNNGTSIGTHCKERNEASTKLEKSSDALAPILRTALVINWKEEMMRTRYKRFTQMFPQITTLSALKKVLDNTKPLEFCIKYLNINANPLAPEKNPKYRLLKELTNGFLEYQQEYNLATEIEALRHWAKQVNRSKLGKDFIGRRFGVGPGVVENIRLNLGCNVVKPDRHVISVMEKLCGGIPFECYNEFARLLDLDPRYFDCLLFQYGKVKGLSGECGSNG